MNVNRNGKWIEDMTASFVIATYNRMDDLDRCLASVLKQEGCDIEVIVIDDASPDGTLEMIERKYGSAVQVVARETNCGSIKNRNYGAGIAKGDVLFLIDDDVELPGVHTAREVLEHFQSPEVGAVGIPYLQHGEAFHAAPECAQDGEVYVFASYVGCASAVRRETFLELGGYETFFHHQVEEDDFCLRMLEQGKFVVLGKVSEPMQHYESPQRNFYKWDYYGRRNSLLYVYKNCPAGYVLPNLLATTVNGLIHAIRIKRFKGNLAGLAAGWGGIWSSMRGNGLKRKAVSKEVYRLSRSLRNGPEKYEDCLQALGLSGRAPEGGPAPV